VTACSSGPRDCAIGAGVDLGDTVHKPNNVRALGDRGRKEPAALQVGTDGRIAQRPEPKEAHEGGEKAAPLHLWKKAQTTQVHDRAFRDRPVVDRAGEADQTIVLIDER
jgi:hypothetical protein